MAGRLDGKVAVVTGGASGIGLASVRLFASEGAEIAIVDRDVANLPEAVREAGGGPSLLLEGDVGDEETVERHAAAVAERFGGFDILLACAGWSNRRSVADTPLDEWEGVLNTNLTGSFLWSRAAIASMRARGGGAIILIASQLAFAGGRHNAAYIASKGAVVSLVRTMAVDHASEGSGSTRSPPARPGPRSSNRAFARPRTRPRRRPGPSRATPSDGSAGQRRWHGPRSSLRATTPRSHRHVPDGGRRLDRGLTSRRALLRAVREEVGPGPETPHEADGARSPAPPRRAPPRPGVGRTTASRGLSRCGTHAGSRVGS